MADRALLAGYPRFIRLETWSTFREPVELENVCKPQESPHMSGIGVTQDRMWDHCCALNKTAAPKERPWHEKESFGNLDDDLFDGSKVKFHRQFCFRFMAYSEWVPKGRAHAIYSQYVMVMYDTIMHTAQQLQWENFGQIALSKASYGVSFVSYTKKNYCDISGTHYVFHHFVWEQACVFF